MLESRRNLLPPRLALIWLLAVVTLISLGTAGFVWLEHWNLADALYMSVITLTTVGFREVGPLDGAGRVLTAALSISAVVLIFGTVGIVTEIVASAAFTRRHQDRMRRTVDALDQHYLVCGFGRVGSTVARELVADGAQVVVLEAEASAATRAQEAGFGVVVGDATDDATLQTAGIERARGLVAALDSDANNLYVVLSARELNPNLFVVTRATSAAAEAKLRRAGADRVVSPYEMAGHRLAALVRRPRVVDFVDAAMRGGATASFALEELSVAADSVLAGLSLTELQARGADVLAVVDIRGIIDTAPNPDRRLVPDESVIVAGPAAALAALRASV